MSGLQRLALLAVVVACAMGAIFSVDRNSRPTARIDPSQGPSELADLTQKPIVPAESLDEVRKAERSRRAQRPAGDPERKVGWTNALNYAGVLKGWEAFGARLHPKPAEPMPPTSCRAVEPAPKHADPFSGSHRAHDLTVALFESQSGFGVWRMITTENNRGVVMATEVVDRVELVSLLTDDQPSVYVLDEMATPVLARQAKRRPLDEFERLGLDAVRRGEELVWTREAPTRMFGAIRASASCLDCHVNAKKDDLLGAFTYYLNAPVDKLKVQQ